MRKLPPSHAGFPHDPRFGDVRPAVYRPNGPKEAVHQVGVPIASLDKSPDGRMAALAGHHVLKTVRLDESDTDVHEVLDVRGLITAQNSPRATSAIVSIADQLSIRDVKWGIGRSSTSLFTACVAGKIFQYDLGRLGVRVSGGGTSTPYVDFVQTQEQESSRQINTVDINPHMGTYLLSGSQDGYVRGYDSHNLVESRFGLAFKPMQVFKCNGDVRHVQWSPKEGFYFACCTDQGAVMKWDIRRPNVPVLRITGHEKAAASISWHPDGQHLLSGGVDKKCHVWDMSRAANKRQRPKWTLDTPSPVARVAWRPGQWSSTCRGLRVAQVAVSYSAGDPKAASVSAVHVWDLARPTIPYKAIDRSWCAPSALLWKNSELLWTAGEDGVFRQSDVSFAPRAIDRVAVSTLAFSPSGDVLTFLDERIPTLQPRLLAPTHSDVPLTTATGPATAATSVSSYGSDPTIPALSVSHSDSEEDVNSGFLQPHRRSGRRRRRSSVHRLSSTPPRADPRAGKRSLFVPLEEALQTALLFRSQQIMAVGRIPSGAQKDVYGYLAGQYLDAQERWLSAWQRKDSNTALLSQRIALVLDTYAHAAEDANQFRLAQVWRILAFTLERLLRGRARYHQEKRQERLEAAWNYRKKLQEKGRDKRPPLYASRPSGSTWSSASTEDDYDMGSSSKSAGQQFTGNPKALRARSLLTEEIASTSNVATPLVRPSPRSPGPNALDDYHTDMRYDMHQWSGEINALSSGYDTFSLPPPKYGQADGYSGYEKPRPRRHLDSLPLSETSNGSAQTHLSSMEGYDFYDTEALSKAIDVPRTTGNHHAGRPSKSPEDFGPLGSHARLLRQDSTDSAGGRIFKISQTTAYTNDSDELATSVATTTTTGSSERSGRRPSASSAALGNSGGVHWRRTKGSLSADPSSRLRRLNRTLLSLEWSGSDLTKMASSNNLDGFRVSRDTYYPAAPQDLLEMGSSPPVPRTAAPRSRSRRRRAGSFSSSSSSMSRSNSNSSSRISSSSRSSSLGASRLSAHMGQDWDESAPTRIRDSDFLPWPDDPPFPFPSGDGKKTDTKGADASSILNPYAVVRRAVDFEMRSSPLHGSAMVMLLQPLVPAGVIDPLQAQAVVRQHHGRLMGMRLFQEAALLRKLCGPGGWGWQGGVLPGRNGAKDSHLYQAITTPAQQNMSVSYACSKCRKPLEENEDDPSELAAAPDASAAGTANPTARRPGQIAAAAPPRVARNLWQCKRCSAMMAPCAVCGHRDVSADGVPAFGPDELEEDSWGDREEEVQGAAISTWWYCAGCGHGGHTACMEAWHAVYQARAAGDALFPLDGDRDDGLDGPYHSAYGADVEDSDGCCPLDGCGHVCLPMYQPSALADLVSAAVPNSGELTEAAMAALSRASSRGPWDQDQDDGDGERGQEDWDSDWDPEHKRLRGHMGNVTGSDDNYYGDGGDDDDDDDSRYSDSHFRDINFDWDLDRQRRSIGHGDGHGDVYGDAIEVGQSRAVGLVREALAAHDSSWNAMGGGIGGRLGTSPSARSTGTGYYQDRGVDVPNARGHTDHGLSRSAGSRYGAVGGDANRDVAADETPEGDLARERRYSVDSSG